MLILPPNLDSSFLADWVEVSLLFEDDERITDTAILDILNEADIADAEEWLSGITQTIRIRNTIIKQGYPAQRQGLGFSVRGDWTRYLPYTFLLLVSMNQIYAELRYGGGVANRPAELFEQITARALEKYLGGNVLRIGAPRRAPVPAAFPAALDFLTTQINEAEGQRDLEDQDSGDDGVDVVGWLAFGDQRESQAVLLAQCAIGTDWRYKRDEISLEVWRRHVDWHTIPLKAFAVPFHYVSGNSWRETASRGGVIFDRLRIARLVPPRLLDEALRDALETWCHERLEAVAELIPT